MSTLPNSGATELAQNQAIPETAANEMGRLLDSGYSRSIIEDRDLTAPPGSCADGARYLVAGSPTGAWSGQAGKLAVALGANASNGWKFVTVAVEGFALYVRDENLKLIHDGSAWVSDGSAGGGGLTVPAEWAPNFTADGDVYIPAVVAMTVNAGNAAIGTGTLAYEKSTSGAPSVFSSTSLPATLQAGAWLKVSATGVTGFVAAHIVRTA